MKKLLPQKIKAIVISDSDTDGGRLSYPRPGYPRPNADGPATENPNTIEISDSESDDVVTSCRSSNDAATALAAGDRNANDIVALKIASAYVVFSGRRVGVFTEWEKIERAAAGYNNMSVKSYGSLEEAQRAWKYAVAMGDVKPPSDLPISQRPAKELMKFRYQGKARLDQRVPDQGAALDASQAAQDLVVDIIAGHTKGKLYWVVIRGRRPGVYLKEEDAQKATMACPHPIVDYAESKEEANEMFVARFMAGEIEVVTKEHLDFLSS